MEKIQLMMTTQLLNNFFSFIFLLGSGGGEVDGGRCQFLASTTSLGINKFQFCCGV